MMVASSVKNTRMHTRTHDTAHLPVPSRLVHEIPYASKVVIDAHVRQRHLVTRATFSAVHAGQRRDHYAQLRLRRLQVDDNL